MDAGNYCSRPKSTSGVTLGIEAKDRFGISLKSFGYGNNLQATVHRIGLVARNP